jgi:predicted nucleic acid-binding Zn ribbon protein
MRATLALPIDVALEIDRLLFAAESIPGIGQDAREVRSALRALKINAFPPEPEPQYRCVVCGNAIELQRALKAASVGEKPLYDSNRCRETARKRRYRAAAK